MAPPAPGSPAAKHAGNERTALRGASDDNTACGSALPRVSVGPRCRCARSAHNVCLASDAAAQQRSGRCTVVHWWATPTDNDRRRLARGNQCRIFLLCITSCRKLRAEKKNQRRKMDFVSMDSRVGPYYSFLTRHSGRFLYLTAGPPNGPGVIRLSIFPRDNIVDNITDTR